MTDSTDNIDKRLLDERNRNNPAYWQERFGDYDDDYLFNHWQQLLFEFDLNAVVQESVLQHLRSRWGVSLASLRRDYQAFLRENGAEGVLLSHVEWAQQWIDAAPPLFYDSGSIWIYNDATRVYDQWHGEPLLLKIAQECTGAGAQKIQDTRAIVRYILAIAEQQYPYIAPSDQIAFAAAGQFYRLEGGEWIAEPLEARHQARMQYPVAPADTVPDDSMFLKFARHALSDDEIPLFAQHIGAALMGFGHRYQKAILWHGRGATGKSTAQAVILKMVPEQLVTAVPPHLWEHEYYMADLAGKMVNLVGEIDDRHSLGASFKNVIGGGLIQARLPSHQPFSFQSRATHIFCTNKLPPTSDRSDAFWRRWSIIEFKNPVPEHDRDPFLAQKIVDREMAVVLRFAMDGAASLASAGQYLETSVEKLDRDEWAAATSSLLAFLTDDEWVVIDETATVKRRELYAAYRAWCNENGIRPLSSWKLKHEIETSPQIVKLGVSEARTPGGSRVLGGVRLVVDGGGF